jgi:hypothetical protein
MVVTIKSHLYQHVKLLSHYLYIDMDGLKEYRYGTTTYWRRILFKLKVEMLSQMYMKRLVLRSLPYEIEFMIMTWI